VHGSKVTIAFAALGPGLQPPAPPRTIRTVKSRRKLLRKVLIIGIDGCRQDALRRAHAPFLNLLIRGGAASFSGRTRGKGVSGPSWASMLTGVWPAKHGVLSNDCEGLDVAHYPHLFRRLKEADPRIVTASITNWGPLHNLLQPGDADVALRVRSDDKVVASALKTLNREDLTALFVQFDAVDEAGHKHGFGPTVAKYRTAIEATDRRVGGLLDGLTKRPNFENEDWLVVISTDHGGVGKSHRTDHPEVSTIFVVLHGATVKAGPIGSKVDAVDVAVTILEHLGVPARKSWRLDGRVIGLR
jgi:predicted AlkP superfamily pyrophosphatase or phosphodiesterase